VVSLHYISSCETKAGSLYFTTKDSLIHVESEVMIHLVTDSTAYLPPEVKQKYQVHTVSLKICVGDQTYDEEGGITKAAFYRLLADVSTAPTTSQPSAGEFVELYERLIDNQDEVISLHISERLSGTVPNAKVAAQQVAPNRIHVVDSRTSAVGLLIMIISVGEAINAGIGSAEILSMLDQMIEKSCAYFMVGNLEYLHKGGRINTAAKFLGTLLNIKPILYMHKGKIEALDKARTSKRARKRVLDEVLNQIGDGPVRAAIAHIQAADEAREMAQAVQEWLDCASLHISEVGPVIGTHVGPGFLGVAACPL
jgi:DegV family protein with EDD domain